MCALGFWELTKESMTHSISFMDYTLSTNNSMITTTLERQIKELNDKLSSKEEIIKEYKEKYKDADIVISKRQLLIIALVSLLITTIGTVAGIYGIKLTKESAYPENRTVLQDPVQSNPSPTLVPADNDTSKAKVKQKRKYVSESLSQSNTGLDIPPTNNASLAKTWYLHIGNWTVLSNGLPI